MIQAEHVTKIFRSSGQPKPHTAVCDLSCTIPGGCIYGLVGSNGAGKSTFLRLLSGVYRPDEGSIEIDDLPVWENPEAKNKIFYVPDDLYFLPQTNMKRMASYYKALYSKFNRARFENLTETFGLDPEANLNTFSKGMRRQAATILALSTMPDYLFFDETFDGLDPVMRNLVKDVIRDDAKQNGTTVIIASHSLRELEDTCDQLSLLHRGGIVFESDISHLTTKLFKVQFALNRPYDDTLFEGMDIKNIQRRGAVTELIVKGDREETMAHLRTFEPTLLEILPLGLEEVFVYEMEALGYAFKDILS